MEFYIVIGIILGLVAGFIPGVHSNTLISFLNSIGIPSEIFPYIIISLFGAYTVTSFVPSIFFGIPDDSSVLTVLPGQKLVKEGNGLLALKTVIFSIVFAALLSLAFFPFSLYLFPIIYSMFRPYMLFILIIVSLVLIAKTKKRLSSFFIFSLSGFLGYSTFAINLPDPFLPLFVGMFAMSAIIGYSPSTVPKQKERTLDLSIVKYIVFGVIGGFIADLIPGVSSPSQVAAFISIIIPFSSLGYLSAISSVSVSEAIFALSSSASIHKSRIGAIVWLNKFVDLSSFNTLYFYLIVLIFSILIASIVVFLLRSKISKIASMNFSKLNILIALYLILIIFFIDGLMGLAVLTSSTLLGYLTLKMDVKRTMLMGSIIIPTILFLLKIFI